MAGQDGEAQGGKQPARLGERYDIFPDRPLAELRSPNAAGFVASDRDRPVANIFGLVCDSDLPPRHEVIAVLTRPDAAVGRHGKPQPSPVARLALEQGIPLLRPRRPRPCLETTARSSTSTASPVTTSAPRPQG